MTSLDFVREQTFMEAADHIGRLTVEVRRRAKLESTSVEKVMEAQAVALDWVRREIEMLAAKQTA
jgi:hypothetical protein